MKATLTGTCDRAACLGWSRRKLGRDIQPEVRRPLGRCDLGRAGPLLTLDLEGDGVSDTRCRGIVGTRGPLGRGKVAAADLHGLLPARARTEDD